ncbi:MAG: hypothetical protein GY788_07640 [bacterium]|nr:hypothetical protein [bacterium]
MAVGAVGVVWWIWRFRRGSLQNAARTAFAESGLLLTALASFAVWDAIVLVPTLGALLAYLAVAVVGFTRWPRVTKAVIGPAAIAAQLSQLRGATCADSSLTSGAMWALAGTFTLICVGYAVARVSVWPPSLRHVGDLALVAFGGAQLLLFVASPSGYALVGSALGAGLWAAILLTAGAVLLGLIAMPRFTVGALGIALAVAGVLVDVSWGQACGLRGTGTAFAIAFGTAVVLIRSLVQSKR